MNSTSLTTSPTINIANTRVSAETRPSVEQPASMATTNGSAGYHSNLSNNPIAQETAAIILKALTNHGQSSTDDNGASMDLSLNKLLQASQPASIVGKMPQVMSDHRVVQARVLHNVLVPNTTASTPSTHLLDTHSIQKPSADVAAATYRVTLALNIRGAQQTIDLALPAPLPQGKWVQIELQPNGSALLRHSMPPEKMALSINEQSIQSGLKRALPIQQTPQAIVTTVNELMVRPAFSKLPIAVQNALTALKQQWPSPQQVSEPSSLQKVLSNSGAFYEAKLRQTLPDLPKPLDITTPIRKENNLPVTNNNVSSTNSGNTTRIDPNVILGLIQTAHQTPSLANDQKGMAIELLALISQLLKKPNTSSDEHSEIITNIPLTYPKPQIHSKGAQFNNQDAADDTSVILKEISKLLLSTLARTQLHQLDSLQSKASPENTTTPTATWVLEVPIQQGQRTDTLGVRIEEHASKKNKDSRTTQWIVNLTIDLEKLGQLQAQLKIRNKQAKATLWTERLSTNHLIKKHVQELRVNLEKVGISVEDIDVYQGLPDHLPSHALQKQLIDVRT